MKRITSLLACLALIASSQLSALNNVPTTNPIDTNSIKEIKEPSKAKKKVLSKEELHIIPHLRLLIEVDQKSEMIKVEMEGESNGYLQWVLFQPNKTTISRHTTTSRINEIKISTLEKGDYILMVKDEEGRALFHNFTKA